MTGMFQIKYNCANEIAIDVEKLIVLKDSPFFKDEAKRQIWESYHNNRIIKTSARFIEELQMFQTLMGAKKGMKILDIGCGMGTLLLEFANMGAVCVGLDIDKESCEILQISSKHFGLQTSAVRGDGCLLPFESESFDVVISRAFFEHVKDVDFALEEQIRVLKKKGKLIIKVGNLLDPLFLLDTLFIVPIETRGKLGGIKWILTKTKAYNCYDSTIQKDEDNKTLWWWKKVMKRYTNLIDINITTKGTYKKRFKKFPTLFEPFLGSIIVSSTKI